MAIQATASALLLAAAIAISPAHAVVSDQWLYLSDDLGSVTVHHTLVSEQANFRLSIPTDARVSTLHVPGQTRRPLLRQDLDGPHLSIEPGITTLQFRSQAMIAVRKSAQGDFILAIKSPPDGVRLPEQPGDAVWTHLVVPPGFEAVRFTSVEPSVGEWQQQGPQLSFHHRASVATTLAVALQVIERSPTMLVCTPLQTDYPACKGDRDGDALPDIQDVCVDMANERATWHGCQKARITALPGVRFAPNDAYLSVEARDTLNRLAAALQHSPTVAIELSAAADGDTTGSLALQRAEGARQYLLMRGVAPGRVTVLPPQTSPDDSPANQSLSLDSELFMSEVR